MIDGKADMVKFLVEHGADINAQDNEGWTPLHAAACCGNLAIVKYLCQKGADLSIVNRFLMLFNLFFIYLEISMNYMYIGIIST